MMKLAIAAVFALVSFAALANGNDNGNGNGGGNATATASHNGNTTATGGTGGALNITSGLGGRTLSPSAEANSTNVNALSNNQDQGQIQGQKQAQGQKQTATAKQGQGQGQNQDASNNGVITTVEIKNDVAAASAASFVAAVGSICGGSAGASGQGLGGGGLLGFAFEFKDCKVIREAMFLAALGKLDAATQHLCNIDRLKDTLEVTGTYTCKSASKKVASKPGRV